MINSINRRNKELWEGIFINVFSNGSTNVISTINSRDRDNIIFSESNIIRGEIISEYNKWACINRNNIRICMTNVNINNMTSRDSGSNINDSINNIRIRSSNNTRICICFNRKFILRRWI